MDDHANPEAPSGPDGPTQGGATAPLQAEHALRRIIDGLTAARRAELHRADALQLANGALSGKIAAAAARYRDIGARHAAALHVVKEAGRRAQDAAAAASAAQLELQALQDTATWRLARGLERAMARLPPFGHLVLGHLIRGTAWFGRMLVRRPPVPPDVPAATTRPPAAAHRAPPRVPFPGFDAEAYLAVNPDIREAGVPPGQHWLEHGLFEGRLLAIPFDGPDAPEPPAEPPPQPPLPGYADWIAAHDPGPAEFDLQRRLIDEFAHRPLVSVLLPAAAAVPLDATVESLVGQTYDNWEACVEADPHEEAGTVPPRWAGDSRVRACGAAGALPAARGEWAVLLPPGGLLAPDALFQLVRAALADPGAALLYADEDQVDADGTRHHPCFRPAWSPDALLNAGASAPGAMVRTDRLRDSGGNGGDLLARVAAAGGRVVHLPRMLFHTRPGREPDPSAAPAGPPRVAWPAGWCPSISLLLPGGDPADPPTYLWPGAVEVLCAPDPDEMADDGAVTLDRLAAAAQGEVVVVLDAGLELLSPDWLAELVGPLADPAVALVAGAVTRPDGVIEAFGAVCIGGEVRPGFAGLDPDQVGPYGRVNQYRNASAAPLRFSALRRTDWQALADHRAAGRPDLSMTLALAQGRGRILLNPFATTVAHTPDPFEVADPEALRARFVDALPEGDPCVSPHLAFADTGFLSVRLPGGSSPADHNFSAEARFVAATYDATADAVATSVAGCAAAPAGRLERLCWVVPPVDMPFYGGIYTILRAAEFMRAEHGVQPLFSVVGMSRTPGTPDAVRTAIARAFPGLAAVAEIETLADPGQELDCGPVDAVVATLWTTAFPALRTRLARRKFYFLQDWEPLFYPAGSISATVEATYRFGFHAICNTHALADSYRALGGTAEHFMPAIDPAVFRPRRGGGGRPGPFRLFCYTRPGTPRNGFETLAAALRELKRRHGEAIDVVTAGAEWQPGTHGLSGVVRHLGLLPYAETGALYRACDAGLVAMATRHPSYLPFEFMACGTAVVTNRNAHTAWLLRDGGNAALCELTPGDIVRAIESVMHDPALRDRIVQGGYDTIRTGHADWSATCGTIHACLDRACRA